MKNETPVIEKPLLKTPLRAGTEVTVTTLAWLLWFYLVMPLVTLILWLLGLEVVFIEQFRLGNFHGLLSVAGYYILGVTALWVLLEGWSVYNRRRFAGHDRRHQADPVTDEEVGRYFGLDPAALEQARSASALTIHFEDENRIRVECGDKGTKP